MKRQKVSLNSQLSDTFYLNQYQKRQFSITVPIISSILIGVNCIKLPFFQEKMEEFLNLGYKLKILQKANACEKAEKCRLTGC